MNWFDVAAVAFFAVLALLLGLCYRWRWAMWERRAQGEDE
jgi:hypothetical protein